METIVSVFCEIFKAKRNVVCIVVMIVAFLLGVPSSLGFGVLSGVTIMGKSILDFFDYISNNIMMPIVALLLSIFIGWIVKPRVVVEEVESSGAFRFRKMYGILIKFIVPVCMIVILISSIVGYV